MAPVTKRKTIPPAKPPAKVRTTAVGTPENFPTKIEPMNAHVRDKPFNDENWAYEPKLDGYRAIAHVHNGKAKLLTRRGHDYSSYFPHLVHALLEQPVQEMVLDAEIVAFEDGRPSFEALQRRVNKRSAALRKDPAQCVLFCFDILHLSGMSTRELPYTERRRLLLESVAPSELVQVVHADDDGVAMYQAALATGLEGVVGKRKACPSGASRYGGRVGDAGQTGDPWPVANLPVEKYYTGAGRAVLAKGIRQNKSVTYHWFAVSGIILASSRHLIPASPLRDHQGELSCASSVSSSLRLLSYSLPLWHHQRALPPRSITSRIGPTSLAW
jgi:hypothetical protein